VEPDPLFPLRIVEAVPLVPLFDPRRPPSSSTVVAVPRVVPVVAGVEPVLVPVLALVGVDPAVVSGPVVSGPAVSGPAVSGPVEWGAVASVPTDVGVLSSPTSPSRADELVVAPRAGSPDEAADARAPPAVSRPATAMAARAGVKRRGMWSSG
jgi:hypothetical protein